MLRNSSLLPSCGSQSRGPGARVCDPQRVVRDRAWLSLRQRSRPANLLRLTEPRSEKFARPATIPGIDKPKTYRHLAIAPRMSCPAYSSAPATGSGVRR